MLDASKYDLFVKSFVQKQRRHRYSAYTNRSELLNGLCYSWESTLNPIYAIIDGSTKYIALSKFIVGKSAYCISYNETFDGKMLSDASPFEIDVGFPVVLIYNDNLAWFKTESSPKANAYFLSK
jgi:hypothetical protein